MIYDKRFKSTENIIITYDYLQRLKSKLVTAIIKMICGICVIFLACFSIHLLKFIQRYEAAFVEASLLCKKD